MLASTMAGEVWSTSSRSHRPTRAAQRGERSISRSAASACLLIGGGWTPIPHPLYQIHRLLIALRVLRSYAPRRYVVFGLL
jgi:hypothetical protein